MVNALTAIRFLEAAGIGDHAAIARGLAGAWLPGRFQTVSLRGKTVVFDVGHNPDAAETICTALRQRFGEAPLCVVPGIMQDKDIAAMMPRYAAVARRIVAATPDTPRAASAATLLRHVPDTFTGEKIEAASVAEAVEAALHGPEVVVCVAVSFFTVGEAMRHRLAPYGDLRDGGLREACP